MVAMGYEFYIQVAETISYKCFLRRNHLDSSKLILAFSCSSVNSFMLASVNLTSLSLAIFQSTV